MATLPKKKKCDVPVCYCDTAKTRGYALYYDYPEGCNIIEKMKVASRYGIMVGLVFSTYDVLMYSHASGFVKILHRYFTHTVPWGLCGATFALVSSKAYHMRQKDDEWNYFLGGVSCAPIVGAYFGSKHAFVVGGLVLGAIGMIKKAGVNYGWKFFPEIPSHRGTAWSHKRDWTIAADPKDSCEEEQEPPCYKWPCNDYVPEEKVDPKKNKKK